MTKEEAIRNTGYTEENLITVALQFIRTHYKKCRSNQWGDPYFTDADFEHYDALVTAYDFLLQERRAD